jgi:quinol-cytochrome oxidoreductase complex cytochrome b subunit
MQWIEVRVDLQGIRTLIAKKTVPVHKHTIWYYFGGITLFLFLVQVVTGILLLLYYRPSAEGAFESVQFIMSQVHFGWLIRSVHSWAANLLVLTAFIHMFSVFFMKAYRKPREITWVSGVLLFFIFLGFGFSGYLLPWNEISFFATKVGTDITGVVPVIGDFLARFLRGSKYITGGTLTRFFGFHVAVLPMLTLALLAVHIFVIQKQGMSIPIGIQDKSKHMPFMPHFMLRDLLGWLVALGILAVLSTIFPWELGIKADPFAPAPAGIMPEWYFVWMFQMLKIFPARMLLMEGEQFAILLFGLMGIFWLCVPFLDVQAARERKSPLFTVIGVIGAVGILVLTFYSYLWG